MTEDIHKSTRQLKSEKRQRDLQEYWQKRLAQEDADRQAFKEGVFGQIDDAQTLDELKAVLKAVCWHLGVRDAQYGP